MALPFNYQLVCFGEGCGYPSGTGRCLRCGSGAPCRVCVGAGASGPRIAVAERPRRADRPQGGRFGFRRLFAVAVVLIVWNYVR